MSTRSVCQRFSFVSLLIILSLLLPVGNPPVVSGHSTQVTMSPADETLYMDMRLSQNATVGSSALVIGVSYLLRISGTWSAWSPNTWSSYCGAPEDAPVIPSPGVTNGKVGVDAEYVFAAPNGYGICGRPSGPPWYNRGPEISLDGGSTWHEATPIDKNYHSDHKYEYLVIGQGYPIRIRFVDSPNSDNYGILPVTVTSITCSGHVTDGAGAGITGVTVSAGAGGSTATDGTGCYTLSGLAEGTYTLTPSKTGYTFTPASLTVTVPPDATGQDFVVASCSTWNLATDFRVSPNQENPSRDHCGNSSVWHFVQSTSLSRDPQTYSLLQDFASNSFGVSGLQMWQGTFQSTPYMKQPSMGLNTTGAVQVPNPPGSFTWPSGVIMTHPAPSQLAIVAWRSPLSGSVALAGSTHDADSVCGDGIAWYIDENSTNLASGAFVNGGSQNFRDGTGGSSLANIQVTAGDFIYVAIHPKTSYNCDSTILDISITATPYYAVSGRVSDADSTPILGVTISDGADHTTTTGSDGSYLLTGLVAGTHTLTPSKTGYTFSPVSPAVTVPPDATGVDFAGATSLQGPLTLVPVVPLAGEESQIMQGGWVHRHFWIRDATGAAAPSVTVTFAPTGVGTSDAAGLLDVAIYADSLGGLGGYGLSVTEASRWGASFALSTPVSFVVRILRREVESFWASGSETRTRAGLSAGVKGYITRAYGGGLEARLLEKYPLSSDDDTLKLKADETTEIGGGVGLRPEVGFTLGPVKGELGGGTETGLTWKALQEFTSEFDSPYAPEQQRAEAITALIGVYRTQVGSSQIDPASQFLGQIILRMLQQIPEYRTYLKEDTGGIGVALESSVDVGGEFDLLKFGKYSQGINRSRFLYLEAKRGFDSKLNTLTKWTTDSATHATRKMSWQEETEGSTWGNLEAGISYGARQVSA